MASEIRANSITSRAGLSTVTMTDSGPMFSGITTFVDNSGFTFGVGGGTSIFTPATNILTLGTNNTEKVRIDANGNANITGVTTAANFKTGVSNLHDVGLTLSGGQIDVGSNIKLGTAGVITATTFHGSGANLTGIDSTQIVTGNTSVQTVDTGSDGHIKATTEGTERLRIAADGSVGIGTNNPTTELQVNAASNECTISLYNGGTKKGALQAQNSFGTILYSYDNEPLKFSVASGTSFSEKLRITSAGVVDVTGSIIVDDAGGGTGLSMNGVSGQTCGVVRQRDDVQHAIIFRGSSNADGSTITGGNTMEYREYGDHVFKTGAGNQGERLRITQAGNIGVAGATGTDFSLLDGMVINTANGSAGLLINSSSSSHNAYLGFSYGSGSSTSHNDQYSAYIGRVGDDTLVFGTNNSIRWRITSSGDIYPQGNYKIGLNSNTAFRMDEVNSNKFVHRYGNSGSATNNQQEAIWYGGGITVMHDNATLSTSSYTWGLTGHRGYTLFRVKNSSGQAIYAESGSISSGSDYRMKENIVEITNGIETVKKLKPSIFNIRKSFNPLDDGKKHHGFIAHEVQEAIPDIGNIVSGVKDGMQEVFYGVEEDDVIPEGKKAGDSTGTFTDKPDYQGIDYGHMTPVLAAAIKELITKVETLEQDNIALREKVETLEQENIALRARVTNLEGN